MRVQVLLYDGFDELDGIGPYEVFDYAAEYTDGAVEVSYVTLDERETVTASHGTEVGVDGTLADPEALAADGREDEASTADAPDLIVVPGGGWTARDEAASAWAEAQRGAIPEALAALHDAGVRIASVCTGSMLLAAGGVTDGRRAVTHASAVDELRESGAEVVDARVVDDGDLLTAGGVTSGLDLALYVVETAFDADLVDRIATVIEYERRYEVV